ncbi:MAG: GNAT family N-acetyltransferase [Verrucomicrobiales bacterium]|nr:GNAT family N-acetyltransferase [Verrucomicrobiales bacterium]
MERLTFDEFLDARTEFEADVQATPNISHFCSSPGWIVPALLEISEFDPAETSCLIVRDGNSWLVFAENRPGYWYPFESAWLFQNPLIGPKAVELLAAAKREFLGENPQGFVIGGVQNETEFHENLKLLPGAIHFDEFPATDCMVADLTNGVDSFLAGRSKKFRRSIRMARDRCSEVKIEEAALDFERMMAIQKRTRKWQDGSDIFHHDDCSRFYRRMIADFGDRLLFRVAKIDGKDAAFLLGSVFGETFRGLQMSFADEFRPLGIGNFLQIDTMRHVFEHERVTSYDLGMFSEYKERWADETKEFLGCFLVL